MKGQDNPLIPNPHPHLLNSTIKKPIIVPSSYQPKKTHKPRKAIRTTEISQSSGPINLVADETVYKEWEDRMERAATTASSLDAEQDSGSGPRCQDTILGGADAQTRFGEQKEKRDVKESLCEELIDDRSPFWKEIEVNAGNSNFMLHNLVLQVQVNVAEGVREEIREDAFNQGRSIEDIDKDAEVSLVDETQGRSDDAEMFDTDALIGNEVFAENDMIEKDQDVIPKEVSTVAPSTTLVTPPVITEIEITLAQTLAKLKSTKCKVVIQEPVQSTATIAPSTIPKAKGITFRDAGENTTKTPTSVSSSSIKDKGKAKMDEPEVPLKKKDQIVLDEEMARNLEAQIQAKLIEEERLAKKKEEEANIALIESRDNTQAMIEKVVKRKLKAAERNQLVRKEQKQESSKRQRIEDDIEIDEHEKAEEDDEAEMKKHMEVVQDDEEIAIDVIPLATKPLIIVEYKIVKEGQKGFYHLIRADGSSNRYSSMIRMLQNISREDLETLWKLVKTKHGNTRPEDDYEKVFWGDLKVMFEPDIKSEIWRSLQGYKVTVWKLFDSSGVHFVRFKNLHIFMLVEKRYPLTPITITNMLNKKLQADYWNEMCYQLLKLMVKQQKGQ
ncbi:hypothetical protein Tco_0676144 [Tanacetum coccineum]